MPPDFWDDAGQGIEPADARRHPASTDADAPVEETGAEEPQTHGGRFPGDREGDSEPEATAGTWASPGAPGVADPAGPPAGSGAPGRGEAGQGVRSGLAAGLGSEELVDGEATDQTLALVQELFPGRVVELESPAEQGDRGSEGLLDGSDGAIAGEPAGPEGAGADEA